MKRDRPNKMQISNGGFFGNNYELTFDGETLIYSARIDDDMSEELISATREDWDAFRSEIDAIGIWKWHADYDNPTFSMAIRGSQDQMGKPILQDLWE